MKKIRTPCQWSETVMSSPRGSGEQLPPDERLGLLRVIDANANRAGEGLRVVEEYVRFLLDDAHLTALCKQLRHDLRTQLERIGGQRIEEQRMRGRDTEADVGTGISTPQEATRTCARDVAEASLKRVEQALRCLEEFTKPLDPRVAVALEQLRYRAYALSRAVFTTQAARDRLADVQLYLLVDGKESLDQFASLVEGLAERIDMLQLRDKRLDDRQMLRRARLAREITAAAGTLLIVNDRPDIARLCQADGVHLGQDDLPVREARRIVGGEPLIGVSTHTLEQARQAVRDGADYIGCGPTFPSRTKTFTAFPGTAFLRSVAAEIQLPRFAIGGISEDNVSEVLACGFDRVAVAGCVTDAGDPADAAERLGRRLRAVPTAAPPAGDARNAGDAKQSPPERRASPSD